MPTTQANMDAALDKARREALDHQKLEDLGKIVGELKADRDKFLRWGVIVLGGAVVTLVTWIFNLLTAALPIKH